MLSSTSFFHLSTIQAIWLVAGVSIVGFGLGPLLTMWANRLCDVPPKMFERSAVSLATGILFALATSLIVITESQRIIEVTPDVPWRFGRLVFHLVLLALLVEATVTDLREYIIPDEITVWGCLFAVVLATVSGDVQLIHLWVDWNHPLEKISGQYIPPWISQHPHWHGLAWSLAGAATGAGITWLARWISSCILGQEAMGLGDVTLMAMIGAFIGWQPVVVVFALAPFCGIVVALTAKALLNRPYVPYGPFLSLAAVIVTVLWKWIWEWEPLPRVAIKRIFGDAIGLGILHGAALVLLLILLSLVRWWKAPLEFNESRTPDDAEAATAEPMHPDTPTT